MKVGFVGLGKLGLPCAVAMAHHGHDVMGYDVVTDNMNKNPKPYHEAGFNAEGLFNPILAESNIQFGSLEQTVKHAEILFVAVQTPHHPLYEGITPIPEERADFDYQYLCEAIKNIANIIDKKTYVVIISTVLPGTIKAYIADLLNDHMRLCYNPYFIAMGTVLRDFLNPEFILLGGIDEDARNTVSQYYKTFIKAPIFETTIENAELIKVGYNTFIGMKISFINCLMEICHKTPNTNIDDVTAAFTLATDRLISPQYLKGGMGDGGGCHPRDNIALSWLSQKLDLSYDFFTAIMQAREDQTAWLADLLCSYDMPIGILGVSFKLNTNITTGSPALLLKNILEQRGKEVFIYDPIAMEGHTQQDLSHDIPRVYALCSPHQLILDTPLAKGSVVLDIWRKVDKPFDGVKYVKIGNSIA